MPLSDARRATLLEVAARLPVATTDDCVLIGIDGVDGSGKTTFANDLADVLRETRASVIRISGDDFHHLREHRYRQGLYSSIGFYEDGFNYDQLREDVLIPLGKGGTRRFNAKHHEHVADVILDKDWQLAPPGSTVVLEGLFLHRPPMDEVWDCSLFLDVPFEITVARMAERDDSDRDIEHPHVARYVGAQRIYFERCDPRSRADIVIDNSDYEHPRIAT